MLGLDGKVAMVTGGASGIGEGTVRTFAQAGARVAIVDIAQERAESLASTLRAAGFDAVAIVANPTIRDEAQEMVARTIDRFGRLDCAVNCVGGSTPPKKFLERSEEDWRGQIDLNLTATFLSLQAEIAAMLTTGGGTIVNVASASGLRARPEMTPYISGKFGVVGLTRSVAKEFATQNVRVNAVCPGAIHTPKIDYYKSIGVDFTVVVDTVPMRRLGRPEEVGAACVWLCSDMSTFVTGVALPIDGGAVA